MLPKYKSIYLINPEDSQYQEHCKRMNFIRNCNRFFDERDSKQVITAWLETVILKYLSVKFTQNKKTILTWEELTNTNKYVRKYREIDGVFNSPEGLIHIEVKASLSKSSFKKGKTQISESSKLLSTISPNSIGILMLADCRCYDPTFGYAKEFIENEMNSSELYKYIEGLKYPASFRSSSRWLWLLDENDTIELAKIYGPPLEDQVQDY